jgi:hypothetical protein
MVRHLGLEDEIIRETISGYELATIEPPLPVLLAYALSSRGGTPVSVPVPARSENGGRLLLANTRSRRQFLGGRDWRQARLQESMENAKLD